MPEEFRATLLRDRAVEFLIEGGDEAAAEWLKACPLLGGQAVRGFGDHVSIELEFGCSRRNMSAFEDEDAALADQIYCALNAVTSPNPVSYSISLRYLTADERNVDRDDVMLELTESTHDEPPF